MKKLLQATALNTLVAMTAFCLPAKAGTPATTIKTVFVIALENHDWEDGTDDQLYQNVNAPFINSLVAGTSPLSKYVAYANAYHNVLATQSGHNPHIHPSEPNYIWSEAGSSFHVRDDNDPYDANDPSVQKTHQHLTAYLEKAGIAWKSYQEDTDLKLSGSGRPINTPAPEAEWTVPLISASGKYRDSVNGYTLSHRYHYATKHNPQVFFTDTDGGDNITNTNRERLHYAPLQQLQADLTADTVASYNWITPDEYNDMHSIIPGGYTPLGGTKLKGDASRIRQGDDFLAKIVPQIVASRAFRDGGAIILWWDESEHGDSYAVTIPEIVLSPLAHPLDHGHPYASRVNLSHSSDLRSMQEIFHVGTNFLRDAAKMPDLSDLFATGAIPAGL